MRYRSVSAAAAGGAAAFADVAAAGRAHLGTAGEAERSVRGPALLRLDQLGGAVRGRGSGRKGRHRPRGLSGGRGGNGTPFGVMGLFYGGRLGQFHRVHLLDQPGRVVAGHLGGALGGGPGGAARAPRPERARPRRSWPRRAASWTPRAAGRPCSCPGRWPAPSGRASSPRSRSSRCPRPLRSRACSRSSRRTR